MSQTQAAVAGASPAARYESLIRLADAIRSQPAGGDLFGLLAEELRRVVPFDAIAQFDETATKVRAHRASVWLRDRLSRFGLREDER